MLEVLGWTVLAIVVAGGLCALAVVVLPAGEQIAPALRDEPVWSLPPDRELTPTDVDTVRLPVAIRGYRFAETDLLLDRLAEEIKVRDRTHELVVQRLSQELDARDAQIASLRGGADASGATAPEVAEPEPVTPQPDVEAGDESPTDDHA